MCFLRRPISPSISLPKFFFLGEDRSVYVFYYFLVETVLTPLVCFVVLEVSDVTSVSRPFWYSRSTFTLYTVSCRSKVILPYLPSSSLSY